MPSQSIRFIALFFTIAALGCADAGRNFEHREPSAAESSQAYYPHEGVLLAQGPDGHGVESVCEANLCAVKPEPSCPNYCSECLNICVQINDCSSCNRVCTETPSCPTKSCTEYEKTHCGNFNWSFGELEFDQGVFESCMLLWEDPIVEIAKEWCTYFAKIEDPKTAIPAYECFVDAAGDESRSAECEPQERETALRKLDHCGLLVEKTPETELALDLFSWLKEGLFDGAATCLSIDDCEVAQSCFAAWNEHVFGNAPVN